MELLLVRAGALGDLLLLRRSVAALHAAGHSVSLVAPLAGRVLLGDGAGDVDRLIDWDSAATARVLSGETEDGPLDQALRRAGAVVAYTRSAAVADALRGRVARLILHDPSPPGGVHASRWLAEPLRELGVEAAPMPPTLRFSAAECAAARAITDSLPERFLAIHPGSGSPAKNWPAVRFASLAHRLAAGRRWLLALGPADDAAAWAGAVDAVVARDLPLRVLGTAISQAGLYLGNDSGVSHLAAASGAPTLALFGPTDPAQWAPLGREVRFLRADLQALSVDEVEFEARAFARTALSA